MVDGRAVLRANGYSWLGNGLLAGVRDRLLGLAGRPHRIPVVPPEVFDGVAPPSPVQSGSAQLQATSGSAGEADRDRFALLPHREAAEALADLVPLRSDWENSVRARIVLDLWGYDPGAVGADTDTPTLLVTGADDPIVPASSVARTARSLSQGTFLALPTGHFSLLAEPWRRRLLGHAEAFLADALGE
jgi:pimeloyl-ACP methyl ester carboxylesterase